MLLTALNRYLFRFLTSTAKEASEPLCHTLGTCWPDADMLEQWNDTVPLPEELQLRFTFALREMVRHEVEERNQRSTRLTLAQPSRRLFPEAITMHNV
jgi:hypothetical protein